MSLTVPCARLSRRNDEIRSNEPGGAGDENRFAFVGFAFLKLAVTLHGRRALPSATSLWNSTNSITADCISGMAGIPAGSIDLAFADPPFNIGYKYDVYEDRLRSGRIPRLDEKMGRGAGAHAQTEWHILAGHRRRLRGGIEADVPA
jgi:hypothetical protein